MFGDAAFVSEATSLVDVEVDRELAVHYRRFRLDAREVVAVALVQGVGAGNSLGNLPWIDRTSRWERELFLDVFRGHLFGTDHAVAGKNRALAHLDQETCLVGLRGDVTEDLDVVELTRGIERLDGGLNIVHVELRAGGQARCRANRGGIHPRIAAHNYRFRGRTSAGRSLLGVQRSRARCDERQHI